MAHGLGLLSIMMTVTQWILGLILQAVQLFNTLKRKEGKIIPRRTSVRALVARRFIATYLENSIASQGKTIDESFANVKKQFHYIMKIKKKGETGRFLKIIVNMAPF